MDLAEAHRILNVPYGAPEDQVRAWHRYFLDQCNPERFRHDPAQYKRAVQESGRVNSALAVILSARAAPLVPPAPVPTPAQKRAGAAGMILGGAALFIVGLAITVGTYDHASSSEGGGTYFVAYGPMAIGAVTFVRGLARLVS